MLAYIFISVFFAALAVPCQAQTAYPSPVLLSTIENFIQETTTKFDSIGIKDKSKGIVLVEFLNIDRRLLPLGANTFDLKTIDHDPKVEVQISMIYSEGFFTATVPFDYTYNNGRPILFYTGFEKMFKGKPFDKKLLANIKKGLLNGAQNLTLSWIVTIDVNKDTVIGLRKLAYR